METVLDKIYTILVNVCGAAESERPWFLQNQRAADHPTEWRFRGHLGHGGKFWRVPGYRLEDDVRLYVTCYREDETPSRLAMITEANRQLSLLQKEDLR